MPFFSLNHTSDPVVIGELKPNGYTFVHFPRLLINMVVFGFSARCLPPSTENKFTLKKFLTEFKEFLGVLSVLLGKLIMLGDFQFPLHTNPTNLMFPLLGLDFLVLVCDHSEI